MKNNCHKYKLLFEYLEGRLTPARSRKFEAHLNSCPHCFFAMSSLIRNSQSPASAEEERLVSQLDTITPAEQAAHIISHFDQLKTSWFKRLAQLITRSLRNAFHTLQDFRWWVLPARTKLRPVLIASIPLIIVIIWGGILFYQTSYQVMKSERLLKNHYRVYFENARLSGGYDSQGIGMLLDQKQSELPYLKTVKDQLTKAIDHGSSSIKARLLLAHAYIIGGQFAEADSVLSILKGQVKSASAVLNDLGVLYYQQRKIVKAADYFQSAIQLDENLLEAQYNLALAKLESRAATEATTILQNYIQKEENEKWRDAAQRFLNKCKAIESIR